MSRLRVILAIPVILFALMGCVPSIVSSTQPVTGGTAISSNTAMPATPVASQATVQQTTKMAAAPSQAASRAPTEKPTAAATALATKAAGTTEIVLGDKITVDGPGASVSGSRVTIAAGGAYRLSGLLSDGQIVVDTQDKRNVNLILSGVDITCLTSAPIYVVDADKVAITLADGTENRVTDGEAYVLEDPEDNEPNAAIFSKSDLEINGNGSLAVVGNHKHGIASKDDLEVAGGAISVQSVGDGIRGRDSVVITGGSIVVNAAGDGIQSNNDEDLERGFVSIEGGTIQITAALDGIQAQTNASVRGGDITLYTGGGSANASSQGKSWGSWGRDTTSDSDSSAAPSAKGIKALAAVTIDGGTLHIDSADDALHSNGACTINGGEITVASGDDGIHADAVVTIKGGEIDITKSYEGIESAIIEINEGGIRIVSSDDGINIVGGVDGSSLGGRPGQNSFRSSGQDHLDIRGGYIVVDAMGDGLDINGAINMTGGTLIINGPTANNNGALDYDRGFKMTGGYLVAVGSSGMAQAPDMSSTQYALMVNFPSPLRAGTLIHVQSAKGQELVTFASTKDYQSFVFSSPELDKGMTCIVYSGGSSSGQVTDGLYEGGNYATGQEVARLTVSNIVTWAGSPGGGPRRGRP